MRAPRLSSGEDIGTTDRPVWARGLREFFLIVAGVLVALFVDNAREELEERHILSDYLSDVAAEIQSNERSIEIMERQLLPRKAESLERVVAFLRDPNAQTVDTAAFVAALVLSSGPIRPWITDDRYQALRSSGTLRLLRDPGIAADLAGFHQGPAVLFDQADAVRGRYQLAVNQIVPIELADDMSWMRGYADLEPDLFTGTPPFDMALQELRARREEPAA